MTPQSVRFAGAQGVALRSRIHVTRPEEDMAANRYIWTVGLLASLPIFNQVDIGINFSLLWALIPGTFLFAKARAPAAVYIVLIGFLALFFAKFLVLGNSEATIRYITYIVFIAAVGSVMNQKLFDRLFSGFEFGVFANVAFGTIQYVGKLTNTFDLAFDVKIWNHYLWHYNPPGGMFAFLPRVSGFTNEPAYLGVLLLVTAFYRLFSRRAVPIWYHILLFYGVVVLANSRTAFLGYIAVMGCALVLRSPSKAIKLGVCRIAFFFSFFIIPLTIYWTTSRSYSALGMYDYNKMLLDDISVFARSVPLIWIFEGNHLTWVNYLFGVDNYRTFSPGVVMPMRSYLSFGLQGGFQDSKSLGGSYFYDFGIVGLAGFIAVQYFFLRQSARGLLLAALINIVFYNLYAFSWPLYWLMIGWNLRQENQKEHSGRATRLWPIMNVNRRAIFAAKSWTGRISGFRASQ